MVQDLPAPPEAPEIPETYEPVKEPAWFMPVPDPVRGVRFVPGRGISRISGDEAVQAAKNDALKEASRIIASFVTSEWVERIREIARNRTYVSEERVDAISRIFSQEPITGAVTVQSVVQEGSILKGERVAGTYYQAFVHLKIPEENFEITPGRCLNKAQAFLAQGEMKKALLATEGAVLRWPDNTQLLERLAMLQEKNGLIGDALQTMEKLLSVCDEKDRVNVKVEILRLEKQYAGGEYSYLEKRLKELLPETEDREKLSITQLDDMARAGGTINYTVLTDRGYEYYGIWIDKEGIFLYPAHSAESGTRLGDEEGALAVPLDVGRTLGPHLFILAAATEQASWFEEREFLKETVNHRTADSKGRLPHRDLAELIEDIRERAKAKTLVTAFFSFNVTR